VLEAVGRDTSHKDEFSLLQQLSSITGQIVPAKLAELKFLPEVHQGVCEKEGMTKVILKFLGMD
jgi:threonine synthase